MMRTAVDIRTGIRHIVIRFGKGPRLRRGDGSDVPVYVNTKCGHFSRDQDAHWEPWEPDEDIVPDCDDCIRRRDLAELVGTHVLDARGEWVAPVTSRDAENAMHVCVRLDGVLYEFKEDPSDGYRSGLDYARVIEPDIVPDGALATFAPMVVEARLCTNMDPTNREARDELLYLLRESDNAVIFEVGTDNGDDYYPSFVHRWSPEGFAPPYLAAS